MAVSIIFVVVFLIGMVFIGFWGMKKTKTLNDFFLGGRTIGPWISAFAYGTTYFSAVLFIGFAGQFGWLLGSRALWIAAGNTIIGGLLAWLVLGKRTRRMTQNINAMTMPEFLCERYQTKAIKAVSAVIIFVFLLPYSAAAFKGLSHLFEANFNIDYIFALLIMVAITGVYLILGGYFAVTLTDFIQGLIMIAGSILMVAILIGKGGGISSTFSSISSNYSQNMSNPKGIWFVIGLVGMTSLGTWGMPQMVQKFYAIKNEAVIKKAAIGTMVFALIITFIAYFTGATAHIFMQLPEKSENISTQNSEINIEKTAGQKMPLPVDTKTNKPLFDRIVPDLLRAKLPQALMALILLLVLSASMSTLSSLVLVSSSSIAVDLYKGHINPEISKENSLAMMRFLSGLFVALSFFIAYIVEVHKVAFISTLMSLSWGAVAGSFMAPYVLGLFWKKATAAGAWSGMIIGLGLAIFTFILARNPKTPFFGGNPFIGAVISMLVPFVVIALVSKFTRPPSKEMVEKAFEGI